MKFGVATSSVLHAALISWGLLNLSAPEVQQIELTGVEIDFETSNESQPVQGETEAEVRETPAPKPTQKPEEKPDPEAQNIGDSKSDEKSEAEAPPADKAVEKTASAPKPDKAVEKPEEVEKVAPKEEPTPATELAKVNDPITEIIDELPDEQPETPEPSVAEQQIAALPQSLPVPVSKPKPPKPNTAKTKDRKQPENEPAKKAQDAKESDEPSVSDIIKNNKTTEQAASGGKKKSTETASLGTSTSSFATRLSRREEDTLISRISRCSTGQAGQVISPDLRVTIILELNPDGTFKISPKGKASGGTSQEKNKFTRDALRYALRCAPYDFLPQEKYDTWKEIVVTFHPSKMFQ
ncbi:MAG: hypothetical protein QNJ29_02185 [Rhizobiaceae bacterium]|nr:hypothetical protein [Rhizobiaceae bacterium]